MSSYFDTNPGFLEPNVKQYGSNMVMTNVNKPTKKKIINIDTRFTDEFVYPKSGFNHIETYTITLPEKLTEVKTLHVSSVEIPISFYNISASLGNSFLTLVNSPTDKKTVIMDDGYYPDLSSVAINLQSKLSASAGGSPSVTISPTTNYTVLSGIGYGHEIDFNTDICGNSDKYNFRSKLGWVLGYRDPSFALTGGSYISPSAANLNTIRYLFLVVDEFSNSFPNSCISPMNNYLMNKKILARICVDQKWYPYGSVVHGNKYNGFLLSDTRVYQGKVDIQRLGIQLVNEYGIPVNLNGLDFSFVLEVEHL
jgi:hypothetical protein